MFTNHNCFLKGIIIIGFLVQFSTTSARTYFVSPDGNDNNPGTKELPWGTWGKAFNATVIQPGDTIYFRGGVYYKNRNKEIAANPSWFYPSTGTGYRIANDGTVGDTIYYYAYPKDFDAGNPPILDGINEEWTNCGVGFYGIRAPSVDYSKFYGLEIRNFLNTDIECDYQIMGWFIYGTGTVIENCKVYNVSGAGFAIDGPAYDFHLINCDAYNIYDPQHSEPGQMGSGFRNHNFATRDGSVYLKNCRAWKCSDQGFSSGSYSYMEYDGCWSFHNGTIPGFVNEAGGHGFKLGWGDSQQTGNPDLRRRVVNCIAAYNSETGITSNDQNYLAHGMEIYNNTAYHNGYDEEGSNNGSGFVFYNTSSSDELELKRILKNNISYDNEYNSIFVDRGALLTNEYNSWNTPPGITITNADFISLDSTGLAGPRQPDGSLPDIDFLKLSPNSRLIDAGTNVGLPYGDNAPDLGAREYTGAKSNMRPSVKISSPTNNTITASPANFDFTISASDIDGTIENVTLLQDGKTIGTKSSPPWSFNWYNVEAGTYNIVAVATDDKGAVASSPTLTLVVEDKPDLISNTETIEVYPNPNNGIFTLNYNDPLQSEYTNINISTIDGKSVYKSNISKDELTKQFNLSHISSGLYIIVLYGKNIITTKKFIKN